MLLVQILLIAILFTLVVGVHEFGHFLFARWRGMDVEEFSIGFGPKLASRTAKSGTTFNFRALPLGGFVRIKGMEPKADASETQITRGFYGSGLSSRALTLIAGPLFSVLGGIVFFFFNYAAFGEPKPSLEPTIGEVRRGDIADKAGIKAGDRIVMAGGSPVVSFNDFRKAISTSIGKPVALGIVRETQSLTITVTPRLQEKSPQVDEKGEPLRDANGNPILKSQGVIGIAGKSLFVPVSLAQAGNLALRHTWTIISETGRVLATPSELKQNAGGVISIATATSKAAEEGIQRFINLAAIISISLGLINLLPIPLMDGGQLAVVLIEWLRGGRRLSLKTQEAIGFVGLVIIGLLFLSVTYLDIGRLFGNQ